MRVNGRRGLTTPARKLFQKGDCPFAGPGQSPGLAPRFVRCRPRRTRPLHLRLLQLQRHPRGRRGARDLRRSPRRRHPGCVTSRTSSMSLPDGTVYIMTDTSTVNAATGEPANVDDIKDDLKAVRVNNSVRVAVDGAVGALRLFSKDATERAAAAEAVFHSRDDAALPALNRAIAQEKDPAIKRVMEQARAACVLSLGTASEADQLAAVAALKDRGDMEARALLGSVTAPACRGESRCFCRRRHRPDAIYLDRPAERVLRPVAWFGAATRRRRAGDHVRRHGRDQHGARRDGDDRRLHHVRRAGGDSAPMRRVCSARACSSRSRWPSWCPA